MPKKTAAEANIDPMEKLARLAAIYVTKDMPTEDAAVRLLGAGFDSATIGGLLNRNPNFANLAKFKSKKG
jgi:hypothetical protein